MQDFDVIVLGIGGMGSATCHALARRGVRVLGLEQYQLGHARGSSHGDTRIIRKAYFEHPDYVPLLERAYALWADLEAELGETLFVRTGLVQVGPPDSAVVRGVLAAAAIHRLHVDHLDARALRERFPGFVPDPEQVGVYEADAGYLRVEACVAAFCRSAAHHGAELRPHTPVDGWRMDGSGVVVTAGSQTWRAQRLVITAGPWASRTLPELAPHLHVQRQVQLWLRTKSPALAHEAGCPAFLFQEQDGVFYGFPYSTAATGAIKLAQHGGGAKVDDPAALARELTAEDVARVAAFAARRMPGVEPTVVRHAVCMYTMSPDEHFVIDTIPGQRAPNHTAVVFAAGMSGHGFKFASVMGEILADLALDGRTDAPVGFLSASRLRDRSGAL